jgi:hypothetical protein
MKKKKFVGIFAAALSLLFIASAFVSFVGGCSGGTTSGGNASGGSATPSPTFSILPSPTGSNVRVVRIWGYAPTSYGFDRVGLFTGGSSTTPYKEANVSTSDGFYEFIVGIPGDMTANGSSAYNADMRFFANGNFSGGHSQCHFIKYDSTTGSLTFQPYGGSVSDITGSDYRYDLN